MKRIYLIILFWIGTLGICAQYSGGGEANPDLSTHREALRDFRDMRFGMFIHWGPVSLRGEEISWSRGREIPTEDYDRLYLDFDPVHFNAESWVSLAKAAGMKYMIITSRHHDGFSLWDSEFTDYDMAATPYGKGVMKELAEACEKEGIRFGTYYSICDWRHPDYPVHYPYEGNIRDREEEPDAATTLKMDRYIAFMKNQLRELTEEFGTFLLWFDGEWEWAWTHDMGMDLYAYMRGLKADILINNRVDKGREGMEDTKRDPRYAGDFATPEQQIGSFDNAFAWETCMTIGTQWAWKPDDRLKSKKECIHTLLHTIGGDGNLLLNVGPMPDGRIEQHQAEILEGMGAWISLYREGIYGTRGGPYLPTRKLVSTHKGNNIYLFLLEDPGNTLKLPLEAGIQVQKAYYLKNAASLEVHREREDIILNLSGTMPEEVATVLVLELDRPAKEVKLTEH